MPAVAGSLPLGVLGRAHGVRGEMIFRPYNPGGADLTEMRLPLTVELRSKGPAATAATTATLVSARRFSDGALVRFQGIDGPERASVFTNQELCVPRAALPPLEDGEFYVADLPGCTVVDLSGRERGKVTGCFWNGTQDILQISDASGEELLLPALPEFLREVDLERRRIVVDDQAAAEEPQS